MKKAIFIFSLLLLSNNCLAASGSDGSSKNKLYKSAKKLVLKAKKLEKKDKIEKALTLYSKAYDQLNKACNEYLKEVKQQFKMSASRALKTKEMGHDSSVELINMSAYSQKGTALVRCVYNFEIE